MLLAAGYPLVATAAVVLVSLGLHTLARTAGLGFLFRLPHRWAPRPASGAGRVPDRSEHRRAAEGAPASSLAVH